MEELVLNSFGTLDVEVKVISCMYFGGRSGGGGAGTSSTTSLCGMVFMIHKNHQYQSRCTINYNRLAGSKDMAQ